MNIYKILNAFSKLKYFSETFFIFFNYIVFYSFSYLSLLENLARSVEFCQQPALHSILFLATSLCLQRWNDKKLKNYIKTNFVHRIFWQNGGCFKGSKMRKKGGQNWIQIKSIKICKFVTWVGHSFLSISLFIDLLKKKRKKVSELRTFAFWLI